MEKISLTALAREHLATARESNSGRSAHTVYGGHEHSLRQTLMAMTAGSTMDDHESPGEATLQVLSGRGRLSAGDEAWSIAAGEMVVIPHRRHAVFAEQDFVGLLTIVRSQEERA